ncbi:transporter substrate-binding domain-containing protein [Shimia ponticola]|uniref:transporter substrate-binding domain-containing protein n=1 Tax=Shimia ponticola TaxID=2582893 RepID=UPI00164B488E|nr:transporter substrate-binding domain-containing protein [Shimia ponticola]
MSCFSAAAQETTQDPLIIPFTPGPPMMEYWPDGQRSGFFIELSQEIAKEIGVDIEFRDYPSPADVVAAMVAGEAHMLAGTTRRGVLRRSTVFSEPVAREEMRLAVLAERADEFSEGTYANMRIGIVRAVSGSAEVTDLEQVEPVEFVTTPAAEMGLLLGQVDGLLVPNAAVYDIARKSGTDGRIRFVGDPIRSFERVVALHESRADLMPAINDAIARIEADGRLEALRQQYGITVPPPPPDVLTVGVAHLPPYIMTKNVDEVSGYFVEVFEGIAERAGLTYQYKEIPLQDYLRGPNAAGVDIIPASPTSETAVDTMDFSTLIHRETISIAFSADDDRTSISAEDLVDLRIGLVDTSITREFARVAGIKDPVVYDGLKDIFDALEAGEVDGLFAPTATLKTKLKARGLDEEFQVSDQPILTFDAAVGLRPGLGVIRDQLDVVIPGFLFSEEFDGIRDKYFGEPVFWTEERINRFLYLGLGSLLLGLGAIGGLWLRGRALKSARNEIRTIFDAATSGIIGLDEKGSVIRINAQARKMLGLSASVPFKYPRPLKFLDVEKLSFLDASGDPIGRAIDGEDLESEIVLLDHGTGADNRSYVRVSSGKTTNDTRSIDSIKTVIVLDDVSNEERNRQVVERKGRLDALGQLTGGIAHDFNNLLASQLMALEAASETKDDATRAAMLKLSMDSIIRGRTLTTRLLSFARKQPGTASSQNTAKILKDFETLVRPLLEKKVSLAFTKIDEDLFQFCDPAQLETALMNCVLNSRDAILRGGQGSKITISARSVDCAATGSWQDDQSNGKTARCVEFAITDDGPGMNAETLARCTDPFFTTKSTNSGTGLGLAMVFGFARQSGGSLRIYSEVGVGTTVQILVPRGTDNGGKEQPVEIGRLPLGNGETILAVDDEGILLELVKTALEELSYNVVTAKSGDEAYERIQSGQSFDLLLTDVIMPGALDGFELAKRTRELLPDKPVIYMSGYSGFTKDEMGTVTAPMIQKPATRTEIAEILSKTLKHGVS